MGGFEWIGGEPKANLRRGAEGAWARRAVLWRVNRMIDPFTALPHTACGR